MGYSIRSGDLRAQGSQMNNFSCWLFTLGFFVLFLGLGFMGHVYRKREKKSPAMMWLMSGGLYGMLLLQMFLLYQNPLPGMPRTMPPCWLLIMNTLF